MLKVHSPRSYFRKSKVVAAQRLLSCRSANRLTMLLGSERRQVLGDYPAGCANRRRYCTKPFFRTTAYDLRRKPGAALGGANSRPPLLALHEPIARCRSAEVRTRPNLIGTVPARCFDPAHVPTDASPPLKVGATSVSRTPRIVFFDPQWHQEVFDCDVVSAAAFTAAGVEESSPRSDFTCARTLEIRPARWTPAHRRRDRQW